MSGMMGFLSYGLGTLVALALAAFIVIVFIQDITQKKHTVLRNFPVIGHLRYFFEKQGEYFRQYDDAGFVADPAELLAAWRAIEDSGRQVVAPFHTHRRQPANFSLIDYRLHNPAFAWHLIISLRDPRHPVLQPFRVDKDLSDFGISDQDACQGSELAYQGPEVEPLALVAHGAHQAIGQLTSTLAPAGRPNTATAA